jgi:hypothetical protein
MFVNTPLMYAANSSITTLTMERGCIGSLSGAGNQRVNLGSTSGHQQEIDWHSFLDPIWRENCTAQEIISKLHRRLREMPEADKPIFWLSLVIFSPNEITPDTIRPMFLLYSQCGELPGLPELVIEKQWARLLALTVENPNNVLAEDERQAFLQKLLPVMPRAPQLTADAVDALLKAYRYLKKSGRLDSPESMPILEMLVRCSVMSSYPSYQRAAVEIQEDIYDHMGEKQAILLQLLPDINEPEDDELPAADVIRRLEKKLRLLEKYKVNSEHTKLAIAAEYIREGQETKAVTLMQETLDAEQRTFKTLPVFDQNAKGEIAVTALCLARAQGMHGDAQSAAKTLDIAKQILAELADDFLRKSWSPVIPAIEGEMAVKSGDFSSGEKLYAASDAQFDVQRVRQQYAQFLKNAPYCKILLPGEETVLQELSKLLRKSGNVNLAEQKEKTLETVRSNARKAAAEERLSQSFSRWERQLNTSLVLQENDIAAQAMSVSVVKSEVLCSPAFKLDQIERLAKQLIEHSRFSTAINLINLALKEPSLAEFSDFPLHATYLQQLRVRAEVTSGQFQIAQNDCNDFLAKPLNKNPKMRNQRLDVRGWQARSKLLIGQSSRAKKQLEEICAEWDKEGTNDFISDFREHVRDLATSYYDLHEYRDATRVLRYYLTKLSYNNGAESDEAKSLLGLSYQKLGNVGLGDPLIEDVVSSIKDGFDGVERIYAITHIADFYAAVKDRPKALKYYRRAKIALHVLKLERLPIAQHIETQLQGVPG